MNNLDALSEHHVRIYHKTFVTDPLRICYGSNFHLYQIRTVHNVLVDPYNIFSITFTFQWTFLKTGLGYQKSNYAILFMHHLALKIYNHN